MDEISFANTCTVFNLHIAFVFLPVLNTTYLSSFCRISLNFNQNVVLLFLTKCPTSSISLDQLSKYTHHVENVKYYNAFGNTVL